MTPRVCNVLSDAGGVRPALAAALLLGAAVAAAREDPATRGRELYERNCLQCHQANGAGVRGVFPPLAGRDWSEREVELPFR